MQTIMLRNFQNLIFSNCQTTFFTKNKKSNQIKFTPLDYTSIFYNIALASNLYLQPQDACFFFFHFIQWQFDDSLWLFYEIRVQSWVTVII